MVNPIPVVDKTAEGEGKMVEGTGAGEGTGEKDVSDQIEETGQLEDLQGQQEQEENNEPKDTEAPIDMDDDFAANLEGIDGDENQEDDEGGDEEQENQVDWDMGDVGEQEEEKQLDPKLFENQPDVQQTDQEEQGANEETGEMAAQTEESKIADEVDEKESQENEEELPEESGDEFENVDDINLDEEMQEDGESKPIEDDTPIEEVQPPEENQPTEEPEPIENEPTDDRVDEIKDEQPSVDQGQSDQQNGQESTAKEDETDAGEQGEQQQETLIGDQQGMGIEEKNDADRDKTALSFARNQADDALADAPDTELVDRDEKDDEQQLQDGNRLAHVLDDNKSMHDRQLAQASTVEQASSTKDRFHRPEEKKEKSEQMQFMPAEQKTNEFHLNAPVIKSSQFEFKPTNVQDTSVPMEVTEIEENDQLEMRWTQISESVEMEAAELAEQLRILIEPTIATKLQGDYKSGKRLNMRKIIGYIASNFVRDRIWLQRKKLDKRDYRVVLAIDSSASMADNQLAEITSSTVCLIERAFQLLDIGHTSVVSFGQNVKILRDFYEPNKSLLGALKFEDKKTDVVALLNAMRTHFEDGTDKLLILIGDGRFDSNEQIKSAIGNLLESNVMVLYVILDSAKNSVYKIKVFKNGKLIDYMPSFPFPYYTVVQDTAQISYAITESVRQFFSLNNC